MKQGWEIKKLGEVCEINYGTRVVQKKDGGIIYPVYGGGGATFRIDRFNREDCLIVSRFAMSNQCVRFVKGKFFLNDSGLSLKTKESTILQPYLDKHIIAYNDKIYSLGKGAAQRNLDINAFKSINISYPLSLAEQERIVAELDCLSGVIEKKKQQLKELDALAQSIFYEMFGDPITNEKGWECIQFKDSCNKIGDGLHGTPEYDKNGHIPFINGTNLDNGRIRITDKTLFVNDREAKKYFIEMNDSTILFSINGTLGKTALFKGENIVLGKSVCYCNLKTNLMTSFVIKLMQTNAFKQFLEENSSKSTIKNVGLKTIREYPIILPPLSLQQAFASKIEAIDKQKELIKQSIKEVETLFNSRMDYYFN